MDNTIVTGIDVGAETTEQREERQRRELLLALFLLLISDTRDYLTAQVALYLSGSSSVHSLGRNLTGALLGAHTQATWVGRRLAGVTAPLGQTDMQFAQATMQTQSGYLTGLLNDLGRARYPDVDGAMSSALEQRLQWYCWRLRGTAEEAWALALPPGSALLWITTAAESCPDCMAMEAANPHRAGTLDKWPGSGQTQCVLNCRCFLTTADGQRCFQL